MVEKEEDEKYEYALKIYASAKFRKPLLFHELKIIQQTIEAFCRKQLSLGEQIPCLKVQSWIHDDMHQVGYVDCGDKETREWIRSFLQKKLFFGGQYRAWRMDEHEKSVITITIDDDVAAAFITPDCFMKHVIASEKEQIPQDSEFEVIGSQTLKTNLIRHCYVINEEFLYALTKLKFTVYVGGRKFKIRKCFN
jgi:regulatory protein YycI of two-component signal transduction system YycFG